jgi:hypothetical protein
MLFVKRLDNIYKYFNRLYSKHYVFFGISKLEFKKIDFEESKEITQ